MITIEIFTKPDCKLCDRVKEKLLALKDELNFEIKEVNIQDNVDLSERYGELIPFININGQHFANYKFDEEKFRERIKKAE